MTCARREVQEEGTVCVDGTQIPKHRDRVVDEVSRQVVAIVVRGWRIDEVTVVHERGRELVRLATEEPIEAVEPARQRPARPRRGQVALVFGREVPLANGIRGVAVRCEHLG